MLDEPQFASPRHLDQALSPFLLIAACLLITVFSFVPLATAQNTLSSLSPIIGTWNASNGQTNYLECFNHTSASVKAVLKLRDKSGSTLATKAITFAASQTRQVNLNNTTTNTGYGTFSLTANGQYDLGSSLVCHTSVYSFPIGNTSGNFGYAYSVPTNISHNQTTFVLANKAQAINNQEVDNWLTIVNTGTEPLNARIEAFDQSGLAIRGKRYSIKNLQSWKRIDISLNDNISTNTALYRITPTTGSYLAYAIRYGRNSAATSNYAFYVPAQTRSCDSGPLPLSTNYSSRQLLEIANPTATKSSLQLTLKNPSGKSLLIKRFSINPKAQRIISLENYLTTSTSGVLQITCRDSSSSSGFVANVASWGTDPNDPQLQRWAYSTFPGSQITLAAQSNSTAKLSLNSQLNDKVILRMTTGETLSPTTINLVRSNRTSTTKRIVPSNLKTFAANLSRIVGQNQLGFASISNSDTSTFSADILKVHYNSAGKVIYVTPSHGTKKHSLSSNDNNSSSSQSSSSSSSNQSSSSSSSNSSSSGQQHAAPSAIAQQVTMTQNTTRSITLAGEDLNGDTLNYETLTFPQHGSLSGAGKVLTYTPTSGHTGYDSFTFRVYDGQLYSRPATVSIYIVTADSIATSNYLIEFVEGKPAASTTHTFIAPASGTPPAKGASVVQPESGHKVTRISNIADISALSSQEGLPGYGMYNGYSRYSNENITSEYTIAYNTGNKAYLYRLSDKAYIHQIVRANGNVLGETNDPRWDFSGTSGTEYDLYYHAGSKIYKQNVINVDGSGKPLSEVVVYDFATDPQFGTGVTIMSDDHMDQSSDARYRANRLSNGKRAIVDMKASGGARVLPGIILSDGGVDISPDGKWFYGSNTYWRISDLAAGDITKTVANPTTSHGHDGWAWDYQGQPVHVYQDNNTDWFCAFNPETQKLTKIFYMDEIGWTMGQHMSRFYTVDKKGWLLLAIYSDDRSLWASEQLLMFEILPREQHPRIWRLGSEYNSWGWPGGSKVDWYFAESFASMNFSGNSISWGANWLSQLSPLVSDNLELYRMDLPPDWNEELERRRIAENLNRGPLFRAKVSNVVMRSDSTLSFEVAAFDPDGDNISLSISGLPTAYTVTVLPTDNSKGKRWKIDWISPETDLTYTPTVTISDGEYSDSQQFSITVDHSAPTLTATEPFLQANSRTYIKVTFSEAVDSTTALNAANYHITPPSGSSEITVYDVEATPDANIVRIETSSHILDSDYSLSVSGIKDIVGRDIVSPNSISYVVTSALENFRQTFQYIFNQVGTAPAGPIENLSPVTYAPEDLGKNESFFDPQYNITIKKLTDYQDEGTTVSNNTPASVRYTPVNSNNTLYFTVTSSTQLRLYDFSTNALIKAQTVSASGELTSLRWDYSGASPTVMYYLSGLKLKSWNTSSSTTWADNPVVYDFSLDSTFLAKFPTASTLLTGSADSSGDSRYWVFMVEDSSGNHLGCVSFDKTSLQILGVLDYDKYIAYGGRYGDASTRAIPEPNRVDVSPLGSKLLWQGGRVWGYANEEDNPADQGTPFDNANAWDKDFTHPIKVGRYHTGVRESGWSFNDAGEEMLVSIDTDNDAIDATNVVTGAGMHIMSHQDLGYKTMNIGKFYSPNKRGWILLSIYNSSQNTWYSNEFLMVQLKPNAAKPLIWRISDTYNSYNSTEKGQAFPALDLAGNTILWGAKYYPTASSNSHLETFQLTLPSNWQSMFSPDLLATDTTAPTVSLTNPTNNSSVSGIIKLTASASDSGSSSQIMRTIFYVDNEPRGTINNGGSAVIFNFDTSKLSTGTHTLKVKASDKYANMATSSEITINVQRNLGSAPVVSAFTSNATDIDTSTSGIQVAANTTVTFASTVADSDGNGIYMEFVYDTGDGENVAYKSFNNILTSKTYTFSSSDIGKTFTWRLKITDGDSTVYSDPIVITVTG